MKIKITTIIFTIFLTKQISSQHNPCPDYFQYHSNGNTKYGIITVPGPGTGKTELKATISVLGGEMYYMNSGGLHLVKSLQETIKDGEQGKDVQYRLDFPQTEEFPVLTKITLNNKDICNIPTVNYQWQGTFTKTIFNPLGATELSYIPDRHSNGPTEAPTTENYLPNETNPPLAPESNQNQNQASSSTNNEEWRPNSSTESTVLYYSPTTTNRNRPYMPSSYPNQISSNDVNDIHHNHYHGGYDSIATKAIANGGQNFKNPLYIVDFVAILIMFHVINYVLFH